MALWFSRRRQTLLRQLQRARATPLLGAGYYLGTSDARREAILLQIDDVVTDPAFDDPCVANGGDRGERVRATLPVVVGRPRRRVPSFHPTFPPRVFRNAVDFDLIPALNACHVNPRHPRAVSRLLGIEAADSDLPLMPLEPSCAESRHGPQE